MSDEFNLIAVGYILGMLTILILGLLLPMNLFKTTCDNIRKTNNEIIIKQCEDYYK